MPKRRVKIKQLRRRIANEVKAVTYQELSDAFDTSSLSGLTLMGFDSRYRALPIDIWEDILEYNGIDKKKYVSDHYDCDNFAMALAGWVPQALDVNGVGIVLDFSGKHAYNALIVAEADGSFSVAVVEPQNDKFIITMQGAYQATRGYVMFP